MMCQNEEKAFLKARSLHLLLFGDKTIGDTESCFLILLNHMLRFTTLILGDSFTCVEKK